MLIAKAVTSKKGDNAPGPVRPRPRVEDSMGLHDSGRKERGLNKIGVLLPKKVKNKKIIIKNAE